MSMSQNEKIAEHQEAERKFFDEPMKIDDGETEPVPPFEPVEFRLLVRLDPVASKTEGGLWIPDSRQEFNQKSMTFATVVKLGPRAFEDWHSDWKCEIGTRVLIDKFAGVYPVSTDPNTLYRIIEDKEIVAVVSG